MLPVPVSTVVCLSRIAELEIIRARKEVNKIKGVDHQQRRRGYGTFTLLYPPTIIM
jgi:hypothetical protein